MGKTRTATPSDPVATALWDTFRGLMPRNEAVIEQALREVIGVFDGEVDAVKGNASKIIYDAQDRAYQIYREAEGPARTAAIEITFTRMIPDNASAHDAVRLIAQRANSLDLFYLSIAQSRKSRAGTALEKFFGTLFRGLGYHFEREHVVNGTPDFVFPSAAHFRTLPADCIVFTSKRTLRERWRQITTEGARGFLLFLGTLDETVKPKDLADMKEQKIYLVVPERIRAAAYPDAPHVISIERFISDHLDIAMDRWRRNRVIESGLVGI